MSELRDNYFQNGYVVIRNFFDKEKIQKVREQLINENYEGLEIFELKLIKELCLNKEFLELFKEILDCKRLLYFSDSTISIHENIENCPSGFHVDSRNEQFDFQNEYPIARAGIYLQNVADFSGGVKIKPKSHKTYCITNIKQSIKNIFKEKILKRNKNFKINFSLKNIQPNLNIGDLIIWNLRLHHSGASWRYRFNKNLSFPPLIDNLMPKFTKIRAEYKKNIAALFIAFANGDIRNTNISNYVDRKLKEKKRFNNFKDLKTEFLDHDVLLLNEM